MLHCLRRVCSSQQQQKHWKGFYSRRFTSTPKTQATGRTTASNESSKTNIKVVLSEPVEDFGIATQFGRLVCAFGMVYVLTEYGVELTICEGPSMIPTIRPRGEIVVLDRFTPRLWGLQGGTVGTERERLAKEQQQRYEETVGGKRNGRFIWHERRVPVNKLSLDGAWDRLWLRLTTGISVGDVVVVQHPDRDGTVCKRVMGLPGDIVTKPTRRTKKQHILDRSLPDNLVVPDGHLWIEGDNAWNSSDSRNYGALPAALIVGRVLLRVWPLRGKAMMERGARPEQDDDPQFSFSGSVVFPAGYRNQIIVSNADDGAFTDKSK
eukprot:scaffold6638_cov127-Cylindrotheca_fusiformis.AAC.16